MQCNIKKIQARLDVSDQLIEQRDWEAKLKELFSSSFVFNNANHMRKHKKIVLIRADVNLNACCVFLLLDAWRKFKREFIFQQLCLF